MLADCLKKNLEAIELVRRHKDKKIEDLNGRIGKCDSTMMKIIEDNDKIMKNSTKNIDALVSKLEGLYQEKGVVDLDLEKDMGGEEMIGPNKRTRARIRKKTIVLP